MIYWSWEAEIDDLLKLEDLLLDDLLLDLNQIKI